MGDKKDIQTFLSKFRSTIKQYGGKMIGQPGNIFLAAMVAIKHKNLLTVINKI